MFAKPRIAWLFQAQLCCNAGDRLASHTERLVSRSFLQVTFEPWFAVDLAEYTACSLEVTLSFCVYISDGSD